MNRIRTIKPELRRHRRIADCGLVASHLSRDLITYADDQGRFQAAAREVKAECFPYFDTLKVSEVEKALQALASPAVAYIRLYEVEGERYGVLTGWFRHQLLKADRVTWSELPPPPDFQPEQMSKALYARWLQDASNGDLPPRGDGSIPVPNWNQSGTKTETERSQDGDAAEPSVSVLEPRARALREREREQERNGTDPERKGTASRAPAREAPAATVTPLPMTPETADRLEALQGGVEGILARPLKALERDLVLEWATTLRRGGELVPVEEVLEVVGRAMARPTPEGSLPANLRWCRDDVAALARSRPASAVDLPRSVRESMSYDQELAQYAEKLRQEGR